MLIKFLTLFKKDTYNTISLHAMQSKVNLNKIDFCNYSLLETNIHNELNNKLSLIIETCRQLALLQRSENINFILENTCNNSEIYISLFV